MHTPEQAKQLWCPMVRASNGEDMTANAGNSAQYRMGPESCRCIADRCAMWREVVQLHPPGELPPAPRGYCGLAGAPN